MIVTGAYLMNDFFKSLSHEAMTVAFILLQSLVFLYNGLFPWQPGTRMVKPFWILMKQEMVGWQWHQLDHMQIICNSLQTY